MKEPHRSLIRVFSGSLVSSKAQSNSAAEATMVLVFSIHLHLYSSNSNFILLFMCTDLLSMMECCCSLPTRPSGSRRSWPRRWGRTGQSPTGSAWEPTTQSGLYSLSLSDFWSRLVSHPLLLIGTFLVFRFRYNAKRRHWRRTKLGF